MVKEEHDNLVRDQTFEVACGNIREKYIEYQENILQQFKEEREKVEQHLGRITNQIKRIERMVLQ